MKKFEPNIKSLMTVPTTGQRFEDDPHKVLAAPLGMLCEVVVDADGVHYQPSSLTGRMPHIDRALKRYWENSTFISGAGLTDANMRLFRQGLYAVLHLVAAKKVSERSVIGALPNNSVPLTQDDLSAVILLALPLSVKTAGRDTIGFQIRNTHTMRVLESLGLSDLLLSPYPVLRPLFEVRCNPFTGYGYGGKQASEVTWRQAAFAADIFGGNGLVLAVNSYRTWSASEAMFYSFSRKSIEQFQANDFDL